MFEENDDIDYVNSNPSMHLLTKHPITERKIENNIFIKYIIGPPELSRGLTG